MNDSEMKSVEQYLQRKFGNDKITLKERIQSDGSVEVSVDGEFIGVIFRDEEDDEVSYAFHMVILEFDLTEDGDSDE